MLCLRLGVIPVLLHVIPIVSELTRDSGVNIFVQLDVTLLAKLVVD